MFRLLKHITQCSKYTPLGRWNITYNKKELDKKIYLANQDHCGPCGYLYDKNIVNNNDRGFYQYLKYNPYRSKCKNK